MPTSSRKYVFAETLNLNRTKVDGNVYQRCWDKDDCSSQVATAAGATVRLKNRHQLKVWPEAAARARGCRDAF